MAPTSKIATCCYCGTRAALVLRGEARHELACANCGAPLHDLKHLPVHPRPEAAPHYGEKTAQPRKARSPGYAAYGTSQKPPKSSKKHKKRVSRKKKSPMRWLIKEAFDVIEDIFD